MKTRPDDFVFPTNESATPGVNVREYFAILALQGLLARSGDSEIGEGLAARMAVTFADALIAELNRNK